MIHPEYWSLMSIYQRLKYGKYDKMGENDIKCYSTLDVENKTVLDIGAYIGDSARLFLKNGAVKVICVEAQEKYARKITDKRCVIVNKKFTLDMLNIYHDCAKLT